MLTRRGFFGMVAALVVARPLIVTASIDVQRNTLVVLPSGYRVAQLSEQFEVAASVGSSVAEESLHSRGLRTHLGESPVIRRCTV